MRVYASVSPFHIFGIYVHIHHLYEERKFYKFFRGRVYVITNVKLKFSQSTNELKCENWKPGKREEFSPIIFFFRPKYSRARAIFHLRVVTFDRIARV